MYDIWRKTTLLACDIGYSEMLKMLLQHPSSEHTRGASFFQDMLIKIVTSACEISQRMDFEMKMHRGVPELIRSAQDYKKVSEELAVQKIQAVQDLYGSVKVVGIKAQANGGRPT
jgi:hypothetical protein